MSKNMGEFEERPKVQEAISVPLRRRRPTGWIVATIVFAVATIALIVCLVLNMNNQKTSNNDEVSKTDCVQETEIELKEPKEVEDNPTDESGVDEDGDGSSEDGAKSEDNEKETIIDTNYSETARKTPVISGSTGLLMMESVGNFFITKSGDVYLNPKHELFDNGYGTKYRLRAMDYDQKKLPGKYGKYTVTKENVEAIGSGISDGKAPTKETFYGYKLNMTNIVAMFGSIGFGQAWNGYNYAFVSKDGTVDWLFISPGMKTEDGYEMKASAIVTKKVGGYTDIASVTSGYNGGARSVVFVKKNGGHIWLSGKITSKLEGFEN